MHHENTRYMKMHRDFARLLGFLFLVFLSHVPLLSFYTLYVDVYISIYMYMYIYLKASPLPRPPVNRQLMTG